MISVVLFALSVLLASVGNSWGACRSYGSVIQVEYTRCQNQGYNACRYGATCPTSWNDLCSKVCQNACEKSCPGTFTSNGYVYSGATQVFNKLCTNEENGCSATGYSGISTNCRYAIQCDSQVEADSANCAINPSAPGCAQDTTYHCQNSGGVGTSPSSMGSKPIAIIFRSVNGGAYEKTAELNGTCQDWGYCEEGVDDCEIQKDSLGRNPCARSGAEYISGSRCYYMCPDGTGLACRPTSTDYIAGATWAAHCPKTPPADCQPPPSSNSQNPDEPSSSSSVESSSSSRDWRDTTNANLDYTEILTAIHDTLTRINGNAKKIRSYDSVMSFNVTTMVENAIGTREATQGLNNSLTLLKNNGVKLEKSAAQDVDSLHLLLDDIDQYLKDSRVYHKDTVYNPLLRDIKDAILSSDSVASGDTSRFWMRDSAFARWWSDYNQDSAASKGVLGKIYDSVKDSRDSVLAHDCNGFNGCLAVYKNIDYCKNAWGVSTVDCVDGGSPFDNMLNVEGSILSTLWEAVWGEDSTALPAADSADTNVTFSPQKDSAERSMASAIAALFSPDSTQAILDKVQAMKDSAEARNRDSVKVQPDSLWLDSAEAAQYAEHVMLPGGTSADCFVCHAELGTLGGLVKDPLVIHIDFADFGGFNWCDIIRAVVKIATLVVCISLTLGSWAAAFGYNPKNDA